MSPNKAERSNSLRLFKKVITNILSFMLLMSICLLVAGQTAIAQTGGTIHNNLYDTGSQVGRVAAGALAPPAAFSGSERPDTASFSMVERLVSLPGRGLNVNLDLNYNSALYQLGNGVVSTRDSYYHDMQHYIDAVQGYPAYGFSLGFGMIVVHNGINGCSPPSGIFCQNLPPTPIPGGVSFIEPNGARHTFREGLSVDSSNIKYGSSGGTGTITYSDGTTMFFDALIGVTTDAYARYWDNGYSGCHQTCFVGDRLYFPTRIRDRHGNYIQINYLNNQGPRISSIRDTLGRDIIFHYDPTNTVLRSISVPGFEPNTRRDVVRFYYQNRTRIHQFLNQDTYSEVIRTISYLYFPGIKSGYHFEYSSYGMIYRVEKLLGMDVDVNGTITNYGQAVASTEYNYPTTPQGIVYPNLPKYTKRTDWWMGNTSGPVEHHFNVAYSQPEHKSWTTITAPNGTMSKTTRRWYQGGGGVHGPWDASLILDEEVSKDGMTYARAEYSWGHTN